MEETYEDQTKNKLQYTACKILGIFILTIILVCGFVFIINYDIAFDDGTDGGWLSPSFGVVFYYFLVAIISIIAAIILKIALKKRVSFWTLLLSAVLLPIICYHFNYHTLKKDGYLYPLVDKGGIFHFIAIGDYNFDGMNDEQHHILYDERKHSTRYGGHFDDTIIDYIDTTAIGTGSGLSGCFCFYDWEERIIELYLDKDSVKLKQVEIIVAFQDLSMAHDVSFYLDNSKLNHTVNKNNTVSIVFDADTCLDFQNSLGGENRNISIEYFVND